jgi:hypothetical protein
VRPRFDGEIEMSEDTNRGSGRVAEVNILEFDMALDVVDHFALGGFGVNFRAVVEELDNLRSSDV